MRRLVRRVRARALTRPGDRARDGNHDARGPVGGARCRGNGAKRAGGAGTALGRDDGSAVVEFLGVALLLLVPIIYLVLVMARLQAASFAAEGAAREAARSFATAPTVDDANRRAVISVDLALDDQGFDDVDPERALSVACSSIPCLEPGSDVEARVAFDVELPFVPDFVQGVVPLAVPVSARHVSPVDSYADTP